jgi:hypothetical protein
LVDQFLELLDALKTVQHFVIHMSGVSTVVLTDMAVRHAKPRAKNYTLPDFDGFAHFVNTNGTKSWHFRFFGAGKQAHISLGTYPEIGLRDACALPLEANAAKKQLCLQQAYR